MGNILIWMRLSFNQIKTMNNDVAMRFYFAIFICCMFLVSCSKSSGIMEYSPNLYSVSIDVDSEFYGVGTAQKKAYEEAKVFCESSGKTISVKSIDNNTNSFGFTNSSIIFQCIDR